MTKQNNKPNLFSYLDKVMGSDGIKTSNKIEISIDRETAVAILSIGLGLVVFSHGLGTLIRYITKK